MNLLNMGMNSMTSQGSVDALSKGSGSNSKQMGGLSRHANTGAFDGSSLLSALLGSMKGGGRGAPL